MTAETLALAWYDKFNRFAADLYPGRYTMEKCRELAELALAIKARVAEKGSVVAVHNYLYPEFHELGDLLGDAHLIGDSLGLSLEVARRGAPRVDFQSVYFMGATAKIITGDATRVFVSDSPDVLGCSLVFGTDHRAIIRWKQVNPDGVVITYVNSDAYTKSLSDYVCTSRNTHLIIAKAAAENPGKRIFVVPDKFLGAVMRQKAAALGADPSLVDIYTQRFGGFNACCYVHEKIGDDAAEVALEENPGAELIIHPECGCASTCLFKLEAGIIPRERAYFLSTSQMLERASESDADKFLIATELGMIYRLRKELPEKEFEAVSPEATCKFMKANTFEKLLRELEEDRLEIVLCDDCCDPKRPYRDEQVVHIPRSTAVAAKVGIDRMLAIR